jgi:predicted protein tyrosine phosphatase
MKKIIFVCHANEDRSPTAELVFRDLISQRGYLDEFEVRSAGVMAEGKRKFSHEMVGFDYVIAMDSEVYYQLRKDYSVAPARLWNLEIPDDFVKLDPELVRRLKSKLEKFLDDEDYH